MIPYFVVPQVRENLQVATDFFRSSPPVPVAEPFSWPLLPSSLLIQDVVAFLRLNQRDSAFSKLESYPGISHNRELYNFVFEEAIPAQQWEVTPLEDLPHLGRSFFRLVWRYLISLHVVAARFKTPDGMVFFFTDNPKLGSQANKSLIIEDRETKYDDGSSDGDRNLFIGIGDLVRYDVVSPPLSSYDQERRLASNWFPLEDRLGLVYWKVQSTTSSRSNIARKAKERLGLSVLEPIPEAPYQKDRITFRVWAVGWLLKEHSVNARVSIYSPKRRNLPKQHETYLLTNPHKASWEELPRGDFE